MAGPLSGIRVLEVEGIGPGPFASMMLADLGADVIVVHRPRSGPALGIKDQPVTDRGKRSIVLDLKSESDREVFLGLARHAHALVEGFRPGVMERLGLGPELCHRINAALVYGRMTGWGQDGPLAERAGHDLNYIAMAGALWSSGSEGERPSVPPTLVGDIGGGALYLVVGILSGIIAARRTGKGTVVDAAIYDGAAHMQNLLQSIEGGVDHGANAEANPLVGAHWSRTYQCADARFLSVQCLEPKFYHIFLVCLGLDSEPDFAENQYTRGFWPDLSRRLEAIFAEHSLAHWVMLFDGTDACVAPVLSPREAYAHPHNQARRVWLDTDAGLQAAAAPRFSEWSAVSASPSPVRGAHTDAILSELRSRTGWGHSQSD